MKPKRLVFFTGMIIVGIAFLSARLFSQPVSPIPASDVELVKLLVRLEVGMRKTISENFIAPPPGELKNPEQFRTILMKNHDLAKVANEIFSTVPQMTSNRAWVKMVVPTPRNPDNQGDPTSMKILARLISGERSVHLEERGAVYYGEPILCNSGCIPCHGTPKGAPDPFFPNYSKEGWEKGSVIGGVISRVETR